MAFELRRTTFRVAPAGHQVGLVTLFAGEADEPGQLDQWISAQVQSAERSMKSVALNQIAALQLVRDLITDEIERLTEIYRQEERSQR